MKYVYLSGINGIMLTKAFFLRRCFLPGRCWTCKYSFCHLSPKHSASSKFIPVKLSNQGCPHLPNQLLPIPVFHRKIMKSVLSLRKTAPTPAIHFILGELHMEGNTHCNFFLSILRYLDKWRHKNPSNG